MPNYHLPIAVVVAILVVFAGCLGGSAGDEQATSTATEGGRDVPATHETQNLSVTNYRFDEVAVTVQAVRGPIEALTFTYQDGSEETGPRPQDAARHGWPRVALGDEVTAVAPANATEVARWATVVPRNETVSLPTVATHENTSYLVIVHLPAFEQVVRVDVVECTPPSPEVERFELQLGGLERNGEGQPISSRGTSCTQVGR